MIAIDTNILVYAHRSDLPFHEPARSRLAALAAGPHRWCVPWPCLHEFLAVVTNPRVFRRPSPLEVAFDVIDALAGSGCCEFIGEGEAHLRSLAELATAARAAGGAIHDARIAAICLAHGIRELWSADRDFSRFPSLRVVNPLIGPPPR